MPWLNSRMIISLLYFIVCTIKFSMVSISENRHQRKRFFFRLHRDQHGVDLFFGI